MEERRRMAFGKIGNLSSTALGVFITKTEETSVSAETGRGLVVSQIDLCLMDQQRRHVAKLVICRQQ